MFNTKINKVRTKLIIDIDRPVSPQDFAIFCAYLGMNNYYFLHFGRILVEFGRICCLAKLNLMIL